MFGGIHRSLLGPLALKMVVLLLAVTSFHLMFNQRQISSAYIGAVCYLLPYLYFVGKTGFWRSDRSPQQLWRAFAWAEAGKMAIFAALCCIVLVRFPLQGLAWLLGIIATQGITFLFAREISILCRQLVCCRKSK